jgi:aryl-alcohol dehydrogenase-like predicted oxidoreductase
MNMNTGLEERALGRSGPAAGAMGIGTWAIGGPFTSGEGCHYPTGAPLGYGQADDAESIRALHCALDMGARLFDTADAYGTGHAERVLGRALKGARERVLIATKFGNTYDEDTKELTGTDVSPAYVRRACQASLKRLQTDWIDLYQLHVGDLPIAEAGAVADTLDGLCDEGVIRSYAWSTDDPERAALFADRARAVAVQFDMNVFEDAPDMLEACDTHDFTGIVRQPLAMGFLSGRFAASGPLPGNDIRSRPPAWLRYFEAGGRAAPEWSERLNAIKEILTSGGRTPAQGALAWVWARSDRTIPIPGVRTVAQVRENLGAMEFGPLEPGQMTELETLLNRHPT